MKHCLQLKEKRNRLYRRFVQASDDWFPSFDDGTVMVSFHPYPKTCGEKGRVSVWGDDDFGMEKHNATLAFFEELCKATLSIKICKDLGFLGC